MSLTLLYITVVYCTILYFKSHFTVLPLRNHSTLLYCTLLLCTLLYLSCTVCYSPYWTLLCITVLPNFKLDSLPDMKSSVRNLLFLLGVQPSCFIPAIIHFPLLTSSAEIQVNYIHKSLSFLYLFIHKRNILSLSTSTHFIYYTVRKLRLQGGWLEKASVWRVNKIRFLSQNVDFYRFISGTLTLNMIIIEWGLKQAMENATKILYNNSQRHHYENNMSRDFITGISGKPSGHAMSSTLYYLFIYLFIPDVSLSKTLKRNLFFY